MIRKLTLPQIGLIAAAARQQLWRHDGRDWTTGTHRHLDVTSRVGVLLRAGLLVRGDDQSDGWLWRPTATALHEARCELSEHRSRIDVWWGDINHAEQQAMEETR